MADSWQSKQQKITAIIDFIFAASAWAFAVLFFTIAHTAKDGGGWYYFIAIFIFILGVFYLAEAVNTWPGDKNDGG